MLSSFAKALGGTSEIRARLFARLEEDRKEKARRREEHETLVARFQEKPDAALVKARKQAEVLSEDLQDRFQELTKHQQLTLIAQAGPELATAVRTYLAVPAELRHQALTTAMSPAVRQSFKKTFPQVLKMFVKGENV